MMYSNTFCFHTFVFFCQSLSSLGAPLLSKLFRQYKDVFAVKMTGVRGYLFLDVPSS